MVNEKCWKDVLFEILEYIYYGYISPSADTLDVLVNHLHLIHCIHPHSGTHILENLVYELHLGTKTLTGYCSQHASFNGVCYPPPLNIGVGRT